MPDLPTLQTRRLLLRPFTLDDAPDVMRLAGDPAVAQATQNIPHPYLAGMAEAWIQRHQAEFASNERLTLAVTTSAGVLGAVGLGIELLHRRAEIGYWVGKEFWGRGYATETAIAVLHFGFKELGLNRIQATHLVRNPASGRVMAKAGMQFEGIHRQHVWKDGRAEDIACYAILRSDLAERTPWDS